MISEENMQVLESFKDLPPRWNDMRNANSISPQAIRAARKALDKLQLQPKVVPVANGSVQLEFTGEVNDVVDFEIFGENNIHMFADTSNGSTYKRITLAEIEDMLKKYIGEK